MKMANIKAFTLLSMICLVAGEKTVMGPDVVYNTSNTTTAIPITTPNPAPTTTTTKVTTSTTTTTVAPTTTTTSTTTTPTTPTTTTTTSTTTPAPQPNTTTVPTTTTVKPTTTPTPLKPGKWVANFTGTNRTCLVLEAALQIDLVVGPNQTYSVNVPSMAKADGICGNKTENITITFGQTNTVTFNFVKTNDSKKFEVDAIVVTMMIPPMNGTNFILVNQTRKFATPVDNSYKCAPERALGLGPLDKSMNYTGKLHISHLQLQAFMNSTSQKFDEALDCEGSQTPDVVPIAVGLALVTLVIIVLIAYLIGRRSQARGYLSMFPQKKREEDYIPMKNLSCFN